MHNRNKLLLLILLAVLVGGVLFYLKGCYQFKANFGVVGSPLLSEDGRVVVVAVTENLGVTYQVNGGYRKTDYRTICWLKQYDTHTGRLLKKKKLFKITDENQLSIKTLGVIGPLCWIHSDQLRAYDIVTMEEKFDQRSIAASNGLPADVFPRDARLIRPELEKGYIDFFSDNGEPFRLFLKDLKIYKKKDLPPDPRPSNEEIHNRRDRQEGDYGERCDTFGNQVFMWAKNIQEAENLRPGKTDLEPAGREFQLYHSPYTISLLGLYNSYTYTDLQAAGEIRYWNPAFARDYYTNQVIHLRQPDGYLVIHQNASGTAAKALLTRLDTARHKVWESTTGVSTGISYGVFRNNVYAFATNKDLLFGPFLGKDALCLVQVDTGKLVSVDLGD